MPQPSPRERFLALLHSSIEQQCLVKLTLGKHRGDPADLQNLFVRPVQLKAGPHLSFVWRYSTRDITKNLLPAEALSELDQLIGTQFLDAHLFTPSQTVQLTTGADGAARVHIKNASSAPAPSTAAHDRSRDHLVSPTEPWLRDLGVTNERAQVREGMSGKFRQINRFVELVEHLVRDANLPEDRPFRVVDMGCGKGYLTFGVAAFFGSRAEVVGIEARPQLVELCNGIARAHQLKNLRFAPGTILDVQLDPPADVLIALHACDTATDDALARGVAAGAALLVVSPCCQKELRPQLKAPPILAEALKHGIFQERQAEFATDSLRAQLLEWAGYRTKVFEFVSTEHTAKNLMIAAIRTKDRLPLVSAQSIRDFAQFYGIRSQALARHLAFSLES